VFAVPPTTRSGLAAGRLLLSPTPVTGAVLAGGASRRYGTNKASVIGPRVLAAMRSAGVDPIVAIGGPPGILPVPTVADRYPGEGPLGAVATALTYARTGRVLIATCDLPLLDRDTICAITDRAAIVPADTAVVAVTDGVLHPSLACWPSMWASSVHQAVRAGSRRFRLLLDLGRIEPIEVEPRAVEDADDPEALRSLLDRHGIAESPTMPDPTPPGA
jgi:molybdopterin-guanine dinucleotide biosynthesis protein A